MEGRSLLGERDDGDGIELPDDEADLAFGDENEGKQEEETGGWLEGDEIEDFGDP